MNIKKFPAPWTLRGNGYIFLYKFSSHFSDKKYFKTDFAKEPFSGFGTIMLIDYAQSTAGPYRELLFIPGEFSFMYKKYYSITKIYVSTMESVKNGWDNWAIPKELAEFEITDTGKKRQHWTVKKDGNTFFDVVLSKRPFYVPVNAKYISHALVQKKEKDIYYFTEFQGKGKGRLAKLESICCNSEYFPDICAERPLAVTAIEDFIMEFPVAQKMMKV